MNTLHSLLVDAHIAVGSIALILFWVPAFAKKGGPLHVKSGRYYMFAMYTVVATAFFSSVMVLADPITMYGADPDLTADEATALAARMRTFSTFLLMLSVLVFASLRHGVAALKERKQRGTLRRPSHLLTLATLAVLAVVVGVIGIRAGELLLIIFAGISLTGAFTMFRDVRKTDMHPRDLLVAHFNGLIGSGIGAYTAFFAFGGSRLFAEILTGQLMVIPWILPAIIGTFVINRLRRSYESRGMRRA